MQIIQIIFSLVILLMSVVIHEISHGYAAYMQGDPTAKYEGRLTLNPLKHIDPFGSIIVPLLTYLTAGFAFGWAKPVPFNPYNLKYKRWGEALVAIAGPLSNILIALLFGLMIRFGATSLPPAFISISMLLVIINLGLAVFNLVPIPPLDGSRIVSSILPYHMRLAWHRFERYSFIIIIVLLLIPQFSSIIGSVVLFLLTHITGIPLSAVTM